MTEREQKEISKTVEDATQTICGVSAMLSAFATVSGSVEYQGEAFFAMKSILQSALDELSDLSNWAVAVHKEAMEAKNNQ